jgi:hypothetical protein
MCWSAAASLNAYLFALFGAAVALANGQPVALVVFLMAFSNVQLVECLLWRRLDAAGAARPADTRYLSYLLCAVIASEPAAAIGLIPDTSRRVVWWAAYGTFLAVVAAAFSGSTDWRTGVAANGHLEWRWMPAFGRSPSVRSTVVAAFYAAWCAFLLGALWTSGHH